MVSDHWRDLSNCPTLQNTHILLCAISRFNPDPQKRTHTLVTNGNWGVTNLQCGPELLAAAVEDFILSFFCPMTSAETLPDVPDVSQNPPLTETLENKEKNI